MDRLLPVLNGEKVAEGRMVEIGTHAELVRADGLYARLARLQFDGGGAGRIAAE